MIGSKLSKLQRQRGTTTKWTLSAQNFLTLTAHLPTSSKRSMRVPLPTFQRKGIHLPSSSYLLQTDIRQADVDLKEKDEEISLRARAIAEENSKLLGNTDSSRKQSIERMGQLDTEITEIEGRITQIHQDISGADAAVKTNSSQANQCDQNVKKLLADMESNKRAIHEYGSIRKDRLLVFGQRSDQLKNAIERNTSWSEKPIGPLGYYIKVKDKSWQPVLETVLGGSLRAYMVVDKRDEQLLQRLMSDCKW
jgi:chromosome segregation ATPase